MKRSEAIVMLQQYLNANFGQEFSNNDADMILDFIEGEVGMEAPPTKFQNIDKDGNRRVSSYNGDLMNHWETDQEVEWKKKNEKK